MKCYFKFAATVSWFVYILTDVSRLVSGSSSARAGASGAAEWPVFFEHLGLVHSIHNKWDLTLSMQFHLPKLEARILKTIHRYEPK